MILSLPEIRAAVAAGEIKFDPPLEDKQWGGASIDLRLGNQFTKLQEIPGMKLSIHEGLGKISGFWNIKELQIKDEFGKNHGPARVELTPLLDRPCQIVFFQLTSPLPETLAYGSRASETFANQRHPLVHDENRVQ